MTSCGMFNLNTTASNNLNCVHVYVREAREAIKTGNYITKTNKNSHSMLLVIVCWRFLPFCDACFMKWLLWWAMMAGSSIEYHYCCYCCIWFMCVYVYVFYTYHNASLFCLRWLTDCMWRVVACCANVSNIQHPTLNVFTV